jgi:hypothetical protein
MIPVSAMMRKSSPRSANGNIRSVREAMIEEPYALLPHRVDGAQRKEPLSEGRSERDAP